MVCPKCNSDSCLVIDSRSSKNNSIRRRRECTHCGYRFTTYEKTEMQIALENRKLEKDTLVKAAKEYYHNVTKQQ